VGVKYTGWDNFAIIVFFLGNGKRQAPSIITTESDWSLSIPITLNDLERHIDAGGQTSSRALHNYAPTVWPRTTKFAVPVVTLVGRGVSCFQGVRHAPILRGRAPACSTFFGPPIRVRTQHEKQQPNFAAACHHDTQLTAESFAIASRQSIGRWYSASTSSDHCPSTTPRYHNHPVYELWLPQHPVAEQQAGWCPRGQTRSVHRRFVCGWDMARSRRRLHSPFTRRWLSRRRRASPARRQWHRRDEPRRHRGCRVHRRPSSTTRHRSNADNVRVRLCTSVVGRCVVHRLRHLSTGISYTVYPVCHLLRRPSDVFDRLATFVETLLTWTYTWSETINDAPCHLTRRHAHWLGLVCRVTAPTHDLGGLLDIVESRDDLSPPSVDVIDVGLSVWPPSSTLVSFHESAATSLHYNRR